MACKYICDGCGKEEMAIQSPYGDFFKPKDWFQRSDKEGIQVACCRNCIDKVAENSGKTRVILPI